MALQDVILGYAKGQKGDKGEKGDPGVQGQVGPQGEPGNIADAAITDTHGVSTAVGQKTTAQKLFDAIGNKILNVLVSNEALTEKLAGYVAKSIMSNVHVNSMDNVPTSALVYAMQQTINQANDDLQDTYLLTGGIEIPDGADLYAEAYKTPGNYYCPSNRSAKTLLNCPVENAFLLKVDYSTGYSYPRQTFKDFDLGTTVSRVYDDYQLKWKDPISYALKSDLETQTYDFIFGSKVTNNKSSEPSKIYKSGNIVTLALNLKAIQAVTAYSDVILTVPSNCRPKSVMFGVIVSNSKIGQIRIGTNGEILSSAMAINDVCLGLITYAV